MGQQQLLLLVLATVIVGLATVAGIEAFDENQQQATQDALVQRAIELGTDLKAAHEKPNQLGGITVGAGNDASGDSKIAGALGLDGISNISASGAGTNAGCSISNGSPAKVKCGSDGPTTGTVQVIVDVEPDNNEPVSVNSISVTS